MNDKQLDRITDLVYDLLNEYDINFWIGTREYISLADHWCDLVQKYWSDEKLLKEKLKEYLKGENTNAEN